MTGSSYTDGDTLKDPMSTPPPPSAVASSASVAASGTAGVVASGWLAANSEFTHADQRKMGRAMVSSLGLHGLMLVLIGLGLAMQPEPAPIEPTPIEKYNLTFVQTPGPGGGGGGGGNQSVTPPARLEMKAETTRPPDVVIETPKITPTPPPPLVAPVQTAANLPMPMAGTLTGIGAAPSLGAGRGGGGGTGVGTGSGSGTGSGIGPGTGGGFGGGAYRPGSGATDPVLLSKVDPKYTPDAMRAKIQGIVELEAVIGPGGVITDIRVHKSLDRAFGLDEEAMRVARLWRFRPAMFQGKPVPMVVIIQMEFRLH